MGAPATLPANFNGWDAPASAAAPDSLPANFDKWDTPKPSVGARVRENFLSGLGVMSDEDAKNFFLHPISTAIKSMDAQGQLALKAKDAYEKGDYKGALMYGLNYLVPFIGPQTAKAGEQLESGDIAGGVARTLGAAVPIVAGSPEARAAVGDAASTTATAAKPAIAKVAGVASDIVDPDFVGAFSPRLAHVQKFLGKLSAALEKSQKAHAEAADLDATESNTPYAGESARGRAVGGVKPTPQGQPAAQAPAPRTVVTDPTTGRPEFSDVLAAKQNGPTLQPGEGPRVVPSVQNIRENLEQTRDAEAAPNRPTIDSREDHALQQEMNWDLEKHGWQADSEARREFLARNSTGVTKAELTGAAEKPVRYTKTPGVGSSGSGVAEDLTDLLQRSLEAAKKAKAQH